MVPINVVLSVIVFLTGFFSVGLTAYSFSRRHSEESALPLAALMGASGIYMVGNGLMLQQTDAASAFQYICLEYFGIAFIPACFIALAVTFSPKRRQFFAPLVPVAVVISVLLLVAVLTNDWHHLYYTAITMDTSGPFPTVRLTRGPLSLIKTIYFMAAMVFAIIRYAKRIFDTGGIDSERMALFIAAFALGVISQIVALSGIVPWNLDVFPLFLLPICTLMAYGIRNKDLFDIGSRASKLVVNAMGDAVLVILGDGTILDANPAVRRFFPEADTKLTGENLKTLSPDLAALCEKLECGSSGEIVIKSGEESLFASVDMLQISGTGRKRAGVALILHDTTEAKRHVTLLEELVIHDGLTGCYTRRHWLSIAERELVRSRRNLRPFAVIMIDIDHFKKINDTRGHAVGDVVLKNVTDAIQAHLRSTDSLGRLGGEEFAVLLPETTLDTAIVTAERLRLTVESLSSLTGAGDFPVQVTISLGVTDSTGNEENMSVILRHADQALYDAKKNRRNRVESFQLSPVS